MSRGEHQISSGAGGHRAGPQYQSGLQRSLDSAPGSTPGSKPGTSATGRPVGPSPKRQRQSSSGDDDKPGTMPAGKALFAGVVALLLAMVLNADQLVRDAERKEFGQVRDFSLAVWEPVASFADALGLNEARSLADQALGREFQDASDAFTTDVSAGSNSDANPGSGSTNDPAPTTTAGVTPTSTTPAVGQLPPVVESSTSSTVSTTTTTQARRIPSAGAPLGLWVGGDSMAQVFGQSLVRLAANFNVIDSSLDYRISTGLTRPDFFNWPAHFADIITEDNPEVMVVIFGANDAQGMELSTGVFQPFDDEWVAEYTARVAFVMAQLTADSERVVLWVGQPRMRSDDFDAKMQTLNSIYQSEAARFEQVIYLDTVPLFSDSDGTYDAFLTALDGETRDLRQQDGTHLSRAGGDLLADAVLDRIGEAIDLTDPTAATSTMTVDPGSTVGSTSAGGGG